MNRCYALSRRAFQGRANGDVGAFADPVVVAVWPGVRLYLMELGGNAVMHVSDVRSADVGTRDRGRFGLWLVFGSAGDGVFNSSDAEWANFKVMVTNDDGSRTPHILVRLGMAGDAVCPPDPVRFLEAVANKKAPAVPPLEPFSS